MAKPQQISTVEKFKRLHDIHELVDQGLSDQEISDRLSLPIVTVQKNVRNLKELEFGELTPENISAKRLEIESNLQTLYEEAYHVWKSFLNEEGNLKDTRQWNMARSFHQRASEVQNQIARIYGLDNVKIEAYTQVNKQINNYSPTNKMSDEAKQKIADIWVEEHQRSLSSDNEL
jgi:regulator of replication initiation timing